MNKYAYPAVFTPEENNLFSVHFPDLEGCYTSGEGLADAIEMAEDVLAFTLYDYEKKHSPIPEPSKSVYIKLEKDEFVNIIACNTLEYQKKNNNKAVKKTLSIPEWLNELAVAANINFSQLLQDALKEKLNLA